MLPVGRSDFSTVGDLLTAYRAYRMGARSTGKIALIEGDLHFLDVEEIVVFSRSEPCMKILAFRAALALRRKTQGRTTRKIEKRRRLLAEIEALHAALTGMTVRHDHDRVGKTTVAFDEHDQIAIRVGVVDPEPR